MDVRLLSGMIGELMLEADSLGLPGLGTFVAEDMPASFSDKGYTVNPPYRRLSFSPTMQEDGRLAALYAASNQGLSQEDAASIISTFCAGLAEELKASRSVEFPGLGRLRCTREGQLFFVPDPDLDISPDACGLEAVSLKTHAASIPDLPEIPVVLESKPAETISPEEETAVLESKPSETLQETDDFAEGAEGGSVRTPLALTNRGLDTSDRSEPAKPRRKMPKGLRWAIGLTAAAAVLLVAFVVVSRLAPDFTDKLLYTPEQLEILNTPIE